MRDSHVRSLVVCGLSLALLAVSALFAVPFGPVPFTLQTAVLVLILCILTPRESAISVGSYLFLGAIGLPIFSGMRGGIGVITGPTGGFLIGFFVGMVAAAFLRAFIIKHGGRVIVGDVVGAVVLIAFSYVLGWLQLMMVTDMGAALAFATGIAPFIVPDVVKAAVAISIALPVRKAVGRDNGRAAIEETETSA